MTELLWRDHLDGRKSIGSVPINDDASCRFGAIDVDVYSGLDLQKIFNEIEQNDLPLIPCRTKSGGLHLFCFLRESIDAAALRGKLEEFAASLGFGGTEIFPKQSEVLSERGDIGGWINMPYFGGDQTDRYAYRLLDSKPLTTDEFIATIDNRSMTVREFMAYKVNKASDISDGPPCLQHLLNRGFSTGSRNDGLFNVGVYLRKSKPDDWEGLLDDYNSKYLLPPLTSSEVASLVKSLRNKDYTYTCDRSPLKPHCNVSLCRTREHGVGQVSGALNLTNLTKYDSRPPIWFVDIDGGGRLELSTEDLQSQRRFQKRCMEVLNVMPPAVKEKNWQNQVQALMESVTLIEAPVDASPRGILFEYLERFCTSRAQARTKDELLLGKPWTEDDFHFFRIVDFMAYLERHRFYDYKVNQVCSMLKEAGGEHCFFRLKGKGVNSWKVPTFATQDEKFEAPDFGEDAF